MTNWPTKKLGVKKWRQQKSFDAELNFEEFCKERNILCTRLEQVETTRKEFLKNSNRKCPDFLCSNNGIQIFVEVKTHTLLTNEARDKAMTQIIQAKKSAGLSGTTIFDPFDPRPELKGVFDGYLRDASRKFKNIKENCKFPRILLLNSHHANEFDVQAIFWGAYPSFYQGGEYAGLNKQHRGLFDSTGSNVSAVIYWNDEQKRFEGRGNSRAIIFLSEGDFKKFFETTTHE